MAVNQIPVYGKTPKRWRARVTAANTSSAGGGTIGTDISLLGTAGTDGSFIESVRVSTCSSAAATATNATVIRLFTSTLASGATSNADTDLIAEIAIPVVTADQTTVMTQPFDIALPNGGIYLQATQTLLVTTHIVAVANTDWRVVAFVMDL